MLQPCYIGWLVHLLKGLREFPYDIDDGGALYPHADHLLLLEANDVSFEEHFLVSVDCTMGKLGPSFVKYVSVANRKFFFFEPIQRTRRTLKTIFYYTLK